MAYRIEPREPLESALKRIALEQAQRSIRDIDDTRDALAAIHSARKRCKKIRGLLRLVRSGFGAYAEENRAIRDAARGLAGFRDSEVVLATHDTLLGGVTAALDEARFSPVRRRLADALPEGRLAAAAPKSGAPLSGGIAAPVPAGTRPSPGADEGLAAPEAHRAARALAACRASMAALTRRLGAWTLEGDAADIVRRGMHRTYARARKAWKKAARTGAPRDYHEWRKRVKYHGHHLRLVRALGAGELADKIDPVRALDDLLGDMHDLAVLESWLAPIDATDHRAAIGVIRALSVRKHVLLETRALAEGRSLFEAKPKRALRAAPQALPARRPRSHGAPDPGSV